MPRAALGSLAIALALVLTAGAARAQTPVAVARERADVDGDGQTDELRLDRDGALSVHLSGRPAASAWTPVVTQGRVVGGRIEVDRGAHVGGGVAILVVAEIGRSRGGARRRQAAAFGWRGGTLREHWRGALERSEHGGRDVALTRYGLVEFEERAGAYRCDGQPAYPNARRFDFAAGRFRAASQPLAIPGDAPVLSATPGRPEALPASGEPALLAPRGASSALVAGGESQSLPPLAIADGDPRTGWVEDKGGFGRGEFVTVATALPGVRVRAVEIVPGLAGQPRFNRPTRLGLLVGERPFWVELPASPAPEAHVALLPEPVEAGCVTALLADVAPERASRRNLGATALAELRVWTDADLADGGPARFLAERAAGGGPGAREAERALARLGPAAGDAVLAAMAATDDRAARSRLRRVLALLPAAPDELVRGLAAGGAEDRERFVAALVRLGDASVPALAAAVDDPAAAEVLGAIGTPAARAALLGAAGRGDRPSRRAVARALAASATIDELVAAAGAAEPAAEADLWRAVGLRGREAAGAERAQAASALADRLADARGYELRTRLVEGAAALGSPDAIAAVGELFAAPRAGAEEVALRRVAAGALGRNPGEAAGALLARAAADPDPGVRLAAVAGLADRRPDRAAADAPLAERLGDRWPQVRRAAAGALGARCGRPGPAAALREAVGDDEAAVGVAALSALVSCRAEGVGELLLGVVADRGRAAEVRVAAARQIGVLGDRRLAPGAAELLRAAKRRAIGEPSAVDVAAALAVSLGQLGVPSTLAAIEEAALDPAFPDLQAAAATALGHACPPGSADLLARLAASPERAVALAARAASDRCRSAGR